MTGFITWPLCKEDSGFAGSLFSIVKELVKKGSLACTKVRLQKDGRYAILFRRLLRRSPLCQQRSINWFKAFVVGWRESGKRCLDRFLDSWHAADLVKPVHRKLIATHNPWVLKNLQRRDAKARKWMEARYTKDLKDGKDAGFFP